MKHAVIELHLADETAAQIFAVWRALAAAGLDDQLLAAGGRPHVSLVVGELADSRSWGQVNEDLEDLLAGQRQFELTFPYFGLFRAEPLVAYLGITPAPALVQLQSDIWHCVGGHFDSLRPHFAPGASVPHCTLSLAVTNAELASYWSVMETMKLPTAGVVEGIDLIDYFPAAIRHQIPFMS